MARHFANYRRERKEESPAIEYLGHAEKKKEGRIPDRLRKAALRTGSMEKEAGKKQGGYTQIDNAKIWE